MDDPLHDTRPGTKAPDMRNAVAQDEKGKRKTAWSTAALSWIGLVRRRPDGRLPHRKVATDVELQVPILRPGRAGTHPPDSKKTRSIAERRRPCRVSREHEALCNY